MKLRRAHSATQRCRCNQTLIKRETSLPEVIHPMRLNSRIIKNLTLKIKRSGKHLTKDEEGAVAIEFAFVALPFFLLCCAILEMGLVFMADVNLTHATNNTARKVRTLQSGIDTVEKFVEDVCTSVDFIPNCKTKLKAEVKVYDDFASISKDSPLNARGELKDNYIFNKGGPGSVITVRTFYEWDIFASLPDIGLGNLPNGNRLMESFVAFRNE